MESRLTVKPKIVMFNPRASLTLPYDGPPMSLLVTCSLLSKRNYQIKIIDWHYPDANQMIAEECRDADFFGVTCLTGYQIKGMMESARIAKKANPSIKVVCGGWHPTFMPEQTFQCREVDYIIIGQGPRTFKELINAVKNNKPLEKIKGLAFRRGNEIIINESRPIEPIANFPPIPYHFLEDNERFLVSTKFGNRVAYILTSQGCPYNCGFCSEAGFYKRIWATRPMEEIVKTVKWFKEKYNIDGVIVSDSNFFVDEKRVADFCKNMISLGIKWGGSAARPDSLARFSEKTWGLMKESGMSGVFIGTESANNRTLKAMNKGCVIEDTLKSLEMAKKYGIWIEVPFIIGVPGTDIEEDFRINMDFVNRHRDDVSQFHMFIYTPYPGTALMKNAMELGYKPPRKLSGWVDYSLHTEGIIPWVPKKYAGITDQLSIYFQFLAGNPRKVIKTVVPPIMQPFALLAERIMYKLSEFRVKNRIFIFPVEYMLVKFVIENRDKIFGRKNLLY